MSATGVQVILNMPQNIVEGVGVSLNFVPVFDDAAGCDIRKTESFFKNLDVAGFHDKFVDDLAAEVNYMAIRMNGPRVNISYVRFALHERNFNVGALLAFFREYLNAEVVGFRRVLAVYDFFSEQHNGERARAGGIILHRQFFGN